MKLNRAAAAAAAALLAMVVGLTATGSATAAPEPGKVAPMTLQFVQQTETAGPVDNPVLLSNTTGTPRTSFTSPFIDVRAFNSFGLNIEVQTGGGATFLNTDQWYLRLDFYADAAGTTLLFWDAYTMYPTNILGSQPIRFTDQMHGAYVRMSITDYNATGRTFRLSHSLYGSFRQMTGAYFRSQPDAVLYEDSANLAAGTSNAGGPAKMSYGWAMASLESFAGGIATMDIRLGGPTSFENRYRLVTTGANQRVNQQIILPKQQAFVVLTNNGAVLGQVKGHIHGLVQPS